jgi:hypothetical protein
MFSSSLIVPFPVCYFLVNSISAVSIFASFLVVAQISDPYVCRSRHSFNFICLLRSVLLTVLYIWLNAFIFIYKSMLLLLFITYPQAINKTIYSLKYVITYHYFISHIHLSFHSHCLLLFTEIDLS